MVNGKVCNSTHYMMQPGDVVEPAPGSIPLFETFLRRRLANNTFVLKKSKDPTARKQLPSPRTPTIKGSFDRIVADGEAASASYRRLPPPKLGRGEASASDDSSSDVADDAPVDGWPAARQAQLDAIVPNLLSALSGDGSGLSAEMARRRGEVSVHAAPQQPDAAATAASLVWQPPTTASAAGENEPAKVLMTVDRGRLRKLLLGLLALRPGKDVPF